MSEMTLNHNGKQHSSTMTLNYGTVRVSRTNVRDNCKPTTTTPHPGKRACSGMMDISQDVTRPTSVIVISRFQNWFQLTRWNGIERHSRCNRTFASDDKLKRTSNTSYNKCLSARSRTLLLFRGYSIISHNFALFA